MNEAETAEELDQEKLPRLITFKYKAIEATAKNAYHEATDDYASAEYRMDVAATLAKGCLESFSA